MWVNDVLTLLLAALGALLLLVSAVGTVRMQGVHQRMQAASVGTSLGISLLLLSAGVHFFASAEMGLMIVLIIFFFVTSPIATTAMARAAYRRLPYTTHSYLIFDDMADPAYTPDYKARAIAPPLPTVPTVDPMAQTDAPIAVLPNSAAKLIQE